MQISEMNLYPIKSLKGISIDRSPLEKRGLQYDRRWMLTDPDGMFLTQREVPRLATISVSIDVSGVRVGKDGFEPLDIPFEPDLGDRIQVTVWNSQLIGEAYRGKVSEWFSEVIKRSCKLVRMPDHAKRHLSSPFDSGSDVVSFADDFPLLLIGEASLYELNERIVNSNGSEQNESGEGTGGRLQMNRFRPNLVVSGTASFEEDNWARVRIGEVEFRVAKSCARCVVTTIDQVKGESGGKEPLKTLATFRKAKDIFPESFEGFGFGPNDVLFGENLIPELDGGTIAVGDEIAVLERRH